jgi:signal transduction histidine kinase
LEIKEDFPAKLFGDELRVKQILNNILSNAIKYTKEGSVKLTVEWEGAAAQYALVRFTVRDTGIGIRSEDMGKLFSDYTQLDAKANRRIEGTGLGLAITKKLVEMMGGNIKVESEYGKGSCFTIEIMQEISGAQTIGEETAKILRSLSYREPLPGSMESEIRVSPSVFKELSDALRSADAFEIERILNSLNENPLDEKAGEALKQICAEVLMAEYGNALNVIRKFEGVQERHRPELNELRTPLTVISGFAELAAENARKPAENGELKNFNEILVNLDAISAETRRMAGLIDKIEENQGVFGN